MKRFVKAELKEKSIKFTAAPNWKNNHKGWCVLHKQPELPESECTCGAFKNGADGNPSSAV